MCTLCFESVLKTCKSARDACIKHVLNETASATSGGPSIDANTWRRPCFIVPNIYMYSPFHRVIQRTKFSQSVSEIFNLSSKLTGRPSRKLGYRLV